MVFAADGIGCWQFGVSAPHFSLLCIGNEQQRQMYFDKVVAGYWR
jgi:hypothetical protein